MTGIIIVPAFGIVRCGMELIAHCGIAPLGHGLRQQTRIIIVQIGIAWAQTIQSAIPGTAPLGAQELRATR